MNTLKKFVGSLALGAILTTSIGFSASAQDWRRDNQWERRNERRYNDRNSSYAREQMERGYRDGLDRGRQDAQTNRSRTPNNSSHYRDGNQYYRQGFERGFYEAYNQYSRYGRGRRW